MTYSHGFGPKTTIFPTLLLGNIGQKNVFYDILKQKNPFLGYKNKKFKKSKNWHFSMVLVPKMAIFPNFYFLGNISQENVFYDILETKNAFLGYKNNRLETSRKIDIFPKGLTHAFGPKMAIFSYFLFLSKYAKKMCFKIC